MLGSNFSSQLLIYQKKKKKTIIVLKYDFCMDALGYVQSAYLQGSTDTDTTW